MFVWNTQFYFARSSLLLHKAGIVHFFLYAIMQQLAYLLVVWPTHVRIAKQFIFFNLHIYNGYGDPNISFAFKSLHLYVFFFLLLTFEKGRSTVGLSTYYDGN
jgi:hypothetical protein